MGDINNRLRRLLDVAPAVGVSRVDLELVRKLLERIERLCELREELNYKGWKLANPDDLDPVVRRDDMVGDIYFSSVLGYNTQSFPTGKQPRSWVEFWDLKKFAGPRMLADPASGNIELEFALLARRCAEGQALSARHRASI